MVLLGEHLAYIDAVWPTLDAEHRALSRQRFADAGWTLCPHPDCPPWSCRRNCPIGILLARSGGDSNYAATPEGGAS